MKTTLLWHIYLPVKYKKKFNPSPIKVWKNVNPLPWFKSNQKIQPPQISWQTVLNGSSLGGLLKNIMSVQMVVRSSLDKWHNTDEYQVRLTHNTSYYIMTSFTGCQCFHVCTKNTLFMILIHFQHFSLIFFIFLEIVGIEKNVDVYICKGGGRSDSKSYTLYTCENCKIFEWPLTKRLHA